ncbi:hypothetical protein SHO565_32650 [Streptomyces sp. HO565]
MGEVAAAAPGGAGEFGECGGLAGARPGLQGQMPAGVERLTVDLQMITRAEALRHGCGQPPAVQYLEQIG